MTIQKLGPPDLYSLHSDLLKCISKRAGDSTLITLRLTCKKFFNSLPPLNEPFCNVAAREGHLDLLTWAKNKKFIWKVNNVCREACLNGHIYIVKHCHFKKAVIEENWLDSAAINGHLDIIKWAQSARSYYPSDLIRNSVASKGHLDMLQYILYIRSESLMNLKVFQDIAIMAALSGKKNILTWLRSTKHHERELNFIISELKVNIDG
jgi:hypothetical protein